MPSVPTPPRGRSWTDLHAELDRWADAGRTATFWWRDDDAVAPTPALGRLFALAGTAGVPAALAVIPAGAGPALAESVADRTDVAVLQHGWAHANHAPAGAKRCELGDHRPAAAVLAELAAGRDRLTALFGMRFVPALVPPWNRIAPDVAGGLPGIGLTGLSTYRPRGPVPAGLVQANTHVDPVDWRGGGFLGEAAALGLAVAHLEARRTGAADPAEPTGLLTHHLTMDAALWAFTDAFLRRTAAHPAVRWLDAGSVFAPAAAEGGA